MTTVAERPRTGLRGFLDEGGFWRLLLVVVVYLGIYLGIGWVVGQVGGDSVDADLLSGAGAVFTQLTVGLMGGAIVLVVFASFMGWTKELFDRQPVYRSWWMWLGPITALVPVLLRILGIDWGRHGIDVVAMVLFTGAMVGFVEELLYRGIGVKMLRDGGHGELTVAALTSLVFAFSHSINLFSGQEIATVAFTWVYTFAFGVLMYLTLRSTGFLVGAMVVHGLTDPTTILATGGLDELTDKAGDSAFLDAAGFFTFGLILIGFVLLAFVRGRAPSAGVPSTGRRPTTATTGSHASPPSWPARGMIQACHTLIYSDDAEATRAFFRDVIGFPHVDAGTGDHDWLIFGTGPSELGIHPTGPMHDGSTSPRHHAISFVVDDLDATMAELRGRGAEFSSGPDDHGYGIVAMVKVPGADDVQLYQPRHRDGVRRLSGRAHG